MRIAFQKVAFVLKKAAQATLLLTAVAGVTATSIASAVAANDRYAAIVVDANTGKTLFSSKADELRYPASLTKMMTIYMMLDAIKAGRMTMNTQIPVSAYAASRPPTKIGFRPGQTIRAEDAILAMITKSANDVAAAVGEYLGGTEERFAQMMTAKARRLGMRNTTFRNASGLPNKQQRTTARDMAILGMALRQHFPREFAYFSKSSFNYRGKTIRGHNRLLGRVEGVDGIKTGYTNASGYNLVSSVNLDGRRLVAVVMGGNTGAARDAHMAQLIRKYLPAASRGRTSGALFASKTIPQQDVPEVVAAAPMAAAPVAAPRTVPIPATRVQPVEAPQYASETGEGDREEMQVLALAAPASRPAARAAQAALAPRPSEPIPFASETSIDPVTTASAPTKGGWAIQIGSLPSQEQANDMLAKASGSMGDLLARVTPSTQTFQKGSTIFYRARFVGFPTKQAAWDACASLKRKNYGCFAVAN
ncbi:D-alanyl-D-alanine carboxypeptidase [Daeguia caeni]|uniref:D-alanyl-D-alanine carboxypeptidase n=1 Tax=Daeguia caeni TaxID=439612 RepID=A0ABV9H3E9_9HYPH